MGQKHKPFREFRTPFPLRDIRENPRSNVRACAAGDGAICSKNRKIVPYHGANPNTRNGARLRSPSPIMAPDKTKLCFHSVRLSLVSYYLLLLSPMRFFSSFISSFQVLTPQQTYYVRLDPRLYSRVASENCLTSY